jgi:Fur family transcriptional regulator, ferric uptake regulator
MDNIINIQESLKLKGYRSSAVRDWILKLLSESKKPLFASEILDVLKKVGLSPNKTTVYRETDKLLAEGIIREVDLLDGKKRYELSSNGCHHHFVCRKCSAIECIDLGEEIHLLVDALEKKNGFKVKEHMLEMFGVCKKCNKK